MNGPSEEQIGGEIICDNIWLSVMTTSGLFCDGLDPPWVMDDILEKGLTTTEFPLAHKGGSETAPPHMCRFQAPSSPRSKYTKMTWLGGGGGVLNSFTRLTVFP